MEENRRQISEVEAQVEAEVERVKNAGLPAEVIKKRGQMTVWERLEYLVDPGTWQPLHTLYNPKENEEGTTGVVDGLAKISGKWAVVVGFDNKVMAGAWIPGQAENILRVTDMAKRLHVPLVWLVNCSGVKLTMQEEVYPDRRGNGTPFYRHAELEKMGIPVLAGIYGTNPAGGGYQGISPTLLLAHKDCNIAVGGGGIVGGMSPKGYFDLEGAQQLIEATRHFKQVPPGSVPIHYNETGFFREVYDEETGVLDALKKWMADMPAYNPDFFRVDEPKEPKYPAEDINSIVAFNQKMVYDFDNMLARLVDGSEHLEFRPDYGPEVYCGLAKIDGLPVGVLANRQGLLPKGYPAYAEWRIPGHRRQALPRGADQAQRVRHPVRPGPFAHDLVSGYLGHRRGRHCGKGRTAGAGPEPDLFHRADRFPAYAGGPEKRHGRGPLHHGRPQRQQPQCLSPWARPPLKST